jgi:hypothetical protein
MNEDLLVYPAGAGLFKRPPNLLQRRGSDGAVSRLRLKEHPRRSAIEADSQERAGRCPLPLSFQIHLTKPRHRSLVVRS